MKKNSLAVVTCSVLALLSCVKEVNNEVIIAKDSQALVYDIKINHHSLNDNDTKAVKTGWEAGDVVYIFFSTIASPKHVEMHYDGSSWTTKEITAGTTEGSIGLTTDGTMTAVYMPFGNDAVVSDNTGQFVFNQTNYSYYLSCVNVPYTVSGGVVSGTLDMNVPEGFVQFFLTNATATNGGAVLREAHITPKAVSGVNPDGTLIIASKDTGTQMPGFAYGTGDAKGYLFSGDLAAGARGTATDYHFNVVVGTSSRVLDGNKTFYRGTPGSYTHRAIKFPIISAWDSGDNESIEFTDANFKTYCVTNFDTSGEGEVSYAEASIVTEINCCTDEITSLGGVEYFVNLESLTAAGSGGKSCALDSSISVYGTGASLSDPEPGTSVATGQLTGVDLSSLTKLTLINVSRNNRITSFEPGSCPALKTLYCNMSNLTELNLTLNTAIERIELVGNQLSSLDVSNCLALTNINCSRNHFTSLNFSNCISLKYISCHVNQLSTINISNCTALLSLTCFGNQFSTLDVSDNTAITTLNCRNNQLSTLDVSSNTALKSLSCNDNQLSALNVANNTALTSLNCNNNQLSALNVANNTALTNLDCGNNQLTSLDVTNNTALTNLNCGSNQLSALDVSFNTALTHLTCTLNQLTALDVSNNTALTSFSCGSNLLTILNIASNTALTLLTCDSNQLSALDVSSNTDLEILDCSSNQLTALIVTNNTALTGITCNSNLLTSLDVSNNLSLDWLACTDNPFLTEIWLKTGQTINTNFEYDTSFATVKYKD